MLCCFAVRVLVSGAQGHAGGAVLGPGDDDAVMPQLGLVGGDSSSQQELARGRGGGEMGRRAVKVWC